MLFLVLVGLLAGVITSISPCVLPVLPVILTAGASRRPNPSAPGAAPENAAVGASAAAESATSAPEAGTSGIASTGAGTTVTDTPVCTVEKPADQVEHGGSRWRPYGVVIGLVISFSLSTLFGSLILGALHLPQDLLRDAGLVVLVVIGLGLLWPRFGEFLERPFAQLPGRPVRPESNGLLLGLGLGLLFVPCAGPVLAAIAVIGAAHRVSFGALLLTASFGIGIGLPLLVLAVAGDAVTRRVALLRRHAPRLRAVGGLVMILVAVLVGFNLTDGLQRNVPGYTTALQNAVEGTPGATNQLHALAAAGGGSTGPDSSCAEGGTSLVNCGSAPELAGITGWLNTPGGAPLSMAQLRGKVVLIDFWTYSCINCQRTLPHLEAWDRSYRGAGLQIIGVHTPEFAFEHVPANVTAGAKALGVHYPVAIDNNYATWNAYSNEYWPAEYLIDQRGTIRHVSFGEGHYGDTEELIRQLLAEQDPGRQLPPSTDVPDTTPATVQTPETYLGYHYAPLHSSGTEPSADRAADYRFPATLDPDTFALAGNWTAGDEQLTAGPGAQLELNCQASDVYLVLGGQGSVTVRVNGEPARVVPVSGAPTLYPLVTGASGQRMVLTLEATPGVQAYDFTFG